MRGMYSPSILWTTHTGQTLTKSVPSKTLGASSEDISPAPTVPRGGNPINIASTPAQQRDVRSPRGDTRAPPSGNGATSSTITPEYKPKRVQDPLTSDWEAQATALESRADRYQRQMRCEDACRIRSKVIARRRVLYRQEPNKYRAQLALSLYKLGFSLGQLSRWEDACQASGEAVLLRRKLYDLNPDAHRAELATSLSELGIDLSRLDRWEDAYRADEEAVTLRRKLYERDPDTYRADLASSLHSVSINLGELKQWDEACQAGEEAIILRRKLHELNPDTHRAALASSLHYTGVCLGKRNRWEEAFQAHEEAVMLGRKLYELDPDTHRTYLATLLYELAIDLGWLKRWEEACRAHEEIVALQRKLYELNPDARRAALAFSLHNAGVHLGKLDRWEEAHQANEEAVTLRRKLYRLNPDSYRADLATSLYSISVDLGKLNRWEEARQADEEAITLRRKLHKLDPYAYCADLATSLHELGVDFSRLDRWEEARRADEEAVTLRRKLYRLNPDAYRVDLAASLYSIGVDFGKLNRWTEARQADEEAVALRRKLFELSPDSYRIDLAASLHELGVSLDNLNRRGDALRIKEEYIALYRAIHQLQSDTDYAQTDQTSQDVTLVAHRAPEQHNDTRNKTSLQKQNSSPGVSEELAPKSPFIPVILADKMTLTPIANAPIMHESPTPTSRTISQSPSTLPPSRPVKLFGVTSLSPLTNNSATPPITVTSKSGGFVASGSYAVIYRGESDRGPVALKMLKAHHEKPYKALQRFDRESKLWRNLSHQNILPFFGVHQDGQGELYMISPWRQYGNLNEFIRKYPSANRLSLIYQAAQGVQYLHNHAPAIVHGDLRGANILISNDRVAQISDFGLSELIEDIFQEFPELAPSDTTTSQDKGNLRWLAPEITKSFSDIDSSVISRTRATDIFSFAMTILETFTSQRPFSSVANNHQVMNMLIQGKRPPRPGADALSRGYTGRLWELTCHCWEENPDARSTANEIVTELRDIISG